MNASVHMEARCGVKRGLTGIYVSGPSGPEEPVLAFVPKPLPPDPAIELPPALRELHDQALVSLGRLDSVSTLLPDTVLFIYMYIRKEAVLSSQIEGTQSSLNDLLLFEIDEAPGAPMDDVREVSCYVKALEHGLRRLRNDSFPVCGRLLREIHEVLMAEGRGSHLEPGELRRSQNWIGGTRPGNAKFVPPPPERVADCMNSLEKFINDVPERTPVLVKAALAHVQFETIHPFLDGNGRLGRLLITLLLCAEGILREPLLYLSLYFKAHRNRYYELLQSVRTDGDWEEWLSFFCEGVGSTAEEAVTTAQRLTGIFASDRGRIQAAKKRANSALRVHFEFQRHPLMSIARAAKATGVSVPTATSAVNLLEELGILAEVTGKSRNRVFAYAAYLKALNEGLQGT